MPVEIAPGFRRSLRKIPAPVREWAGQWIKEARSPGATLSSVLKGSEGLKGGNFLNCYVRKWRKGGPHGEFRLVFRAEEGNVVFLSLDPREDNYKTAARRAKAMA